MTTKRWLGNAAAVTDLWTISLSGTVVSQTYSMTINGKSITYTASGTDNVSSILLALQNVWNASSNPPEFLELTATALPAGGPTYTSMTIAQNVAGRPTTISVSTSGSASFSVANTTVATGPSFFDNGQNWSGGSAPANSDIIVFDNGSVDCCYNINSSLTGVTLQVNPAYSGNIGLPFINTSGINQSYAEYRTTSLTLAGGTAIINSPNVRRCNLAFGANTTTVRVLQTSAQRVDQYTPVVLLTGGNGSSELDITSGDVGVAIYQGQSATFPTINVAYVNTPASDSRLWCGSGCTLTTLNKNGGAIQLDASCATLNQNQAGGTLTLTNAVIATTINVFAGTVNLNSTGTIGTINLYGQATLSADGDPRAKTITNPINVYASSVTVIDSQKSINSGTLSLSTHGAQTVNVNHGGNATIVYS